jgi:hypothetical protein
VNFALSENKKGYFTNVGEEKMKIAHYICYSRPQKAEELHS